MLASCHGIYRGGLGVHAALVAMGGMLGMTLDLARVPQKGPASVDAEGKQSGLRNDQLLFSESCGRFLVTISPDQRDQLEACFRNLPCACVGEVTAEPYFTVTGISGDVLLHEPVVELKKSWKGDFDA